MLKRSVYVVMAIIMAWSLAIVPSMTTRAVERSVERPIVYINGLDGHVVSIKQDGTGRQDYGPGFFPKMSPDGSKIAFSRDNEDFSARDLYVVGIDGTGLQKVASRVYTPGSTAFLFSWAPDGKKLTFTVESGAVDQSTGSALKQIATVQSDGANFQQLTQDVAGVSNINPVWSPNGKYILYQHNADLYTMNTDGGNQRAVVAGASNGSWAPDTSKILFLETGVGVRTAAIDGTGRVTLSPIGSNATWSPDGTKIAMEAPECGCDSGPASILTLNPDGTGKNIVATPPSAGTVQHPVWSPDSAKLAFVEFASWQPARLVVATATGEKSVVIIERVGYPEWAYTTKPTTHTPPHHHGLWWGVIVSIYQWLERLWRAQ